MKKLFKKKGKHKGKAAKEPKVLDERTKLLRQILWGVEPPTLGKIKEPKTREETFKLLKTGKMKVRPKPNRHIIVEYETEATEDAEKREKFKYIKDLFRRRGVVKKRKLKKEYVFIKGRDAKGNIELWKARLRRNPKPKMKPYETPFVYEPVLDNDLRRINEVIEQKRRVVDEREETTNWVDPGAYDRMSDYFLSLFDEDVRNEDGKKRRFTALEFVDMRPDAVAKMIEPYRTPILKRLKKFEQERDERKREKPMLEKHKQKYVRKLKVDETKKKYLKCFQTFVKENADHGKERIIEDEMRKYKYQREEFKRRSNEALRSVLKAFRKYSKVTINDERKDALRLRKETVIDEILRTSNRKEAELEYSYRNIFLPVALSAQKESFQLDMNSYIQYWTKKVRDIEKEVEVQKQFLEKQIETSKILQTIEHIPAVQKLFSGKVKEVQEEGKILVEEALLPLKEKIETLEKVRKDNLKLLNSVSHYGCIIPEFIRRLREFVLLYYTESPEREHFMETLCDIEEFRQELLIRNDKLKDNVELDSVDLIDDLSTAISSLSSIGVAEEPPVVEEKGEEEEMIAFDMAHRILSDGDLEEMAKQLLKVKFIVSDLLTRVIETAESKQQEDHSLEEMERSTTESFTQIRANKCLPKPKDNSECLSILIKMLEANKMLDDAFQIVGNKYSIPDLTKMGEYFSKRTASVNRIVEQHRKMLENQLQLKTCKC